jgi:glycosyltransferase involved in cell wall biosynthesis
MKKLSIITVCRNAEKTLERTIYSVVSQTFKDIEFIIIDGNSSDGTPDIIEKHRQALDYCISEPDSGIYNAMNKGIMAATGEYVYFLNAGDYFFDDSVLERVFASEMPADVVYGDILVQMSDAFCFKKKMPAHIRRSYLFYDTIPHQASIIKRELLTKYGNYDESLSIVADYEFFLRTLVKSRCKSQYLPITFSVYDLKGVSSKISNRRKMWSELIKAQYANFSKHEFVFYSMLSPIYLPFVKYFRYFVFILKAKLLPKKTV